MSDELLGDDFNIFWDQDANWTTPDWVRQISLGDIGIDPNNEQVEIPKRISVKTYKKGRGDWTLSFTMNWDRTNAFHRAVADSIANGTKVHIAVVDGDDIEDAEANVWEAWWMLSGPVDGSLDSVANVEIEGKVHHDTGSGDTELPRYIPGET